VAGSFEHGSESSGSINGGKFPDQLNDSQFLNKNSVPWG
jgi:hypothetical protein